MKILVRLVTIPAIAFTVSIFPGTTLQAQTPAGASQGHKKTATKDSRLKAGKYNAPASTATASAPAATGSGPSSSDIHARVAGPSGKQPLSTKTAAGSAPGGSGSASANIPNAAHSTGVKQSRTSKTVPPLAATGSGPSSSDIHTNTKPATVQSVKAKPEKKKHKTDDR